MYSFRARSWQEAEWKVSPARDHPGDVEAKFGNKFSTSHDFARTSSIESPRLTLIPYISLHLACTQVPDPCLPMLRRYMNCRALRSQEKYYVWIFDYKIRKPTTSQASRKSDPQDLFLAACAFALVLRPRICTTPIIQERVYNPDCHSRSPRFTLIYFASPMTTQESVHPVPQ